MTDPVTVEEFARVAPYFTQRTKKRYAGLDVVGFARVEEGASVCEVGAGTGVFLAGFADRARRLVALDLTEAMLRRAVADHPAMVAIVADGARLPLKGDSFDLATSAQTLHHVAEPLPLVKEMRRVAPSVLIVDQIAPESFERATRMSQLEALRDPSHAVSRPASGYRAMVGAAGLDIVDERIVSARERLSRWMPEGEFPADRRARVNEWLGDHASETGMEWERDGDDWTFTRVRLMLLARRAGSRDG